METIQKLQPEVKLYDACYLCKKECKRSSKLACQEIEYFDDDIHESKLKVERGN